MTMRFLNAFAGSMVAVSLMVAPAAFAAEPSKTGGMGGMGGTGSMAGMDKMANMDEFMKSCDMDHDGMMSRAEMHKHMDKMFDKMDTKKVGKLDKKQSEELLRQLTAPSGG
jgi:hypothetical protein